MGKNKPTRGRNREITASSAARPAASTSEQTAQPKPVRAAAPAPRERGFKVQATKLGYYDHGRRRPGDVFMVAKEADFSEKWMRRVDPRTPERVTGANAAIRQQHDEILAMRHGGGVPTAESGDTPMQTGNDGDDAPLGE